MDDGLLLTIRKLGHELEEIRIRALESIITKLELHIVSIDQLSDVPELFPLLLKWFDFPRAPKKSLVLNFILALVKDNDALNLLLRQDPELCRLHKSIGPEERELFNQLCSIANVDPIKTAESVKSEKSSRRKNGFKTNKKEKKTKKTSHSESEESPRGDKNSLHFSNKSSLPPVVSPQHELSFHTSLASGNMSFKTWNQLYWPSPPLAESDRKVLATVHNSLKDLDQQNPAANFFSTVILHDFPPQIFLNNTSILMILLDLVEKDSENERALRCLKDLTSALLKQFQYYCDSSVISPNCFMIDEGRLEDEEVDIRGGGDSNNIDDVYLKSLKNYGIQSQTLSIGDYCALVLNRVGPLVPGILSILALTVSDGELFWNTSHVTSAPLKHSINAVLLSLANTLLRAKGIGALTRLKSQILASKILKASIPIHIGCTVVPKDMQEALIESLVDPILYLLHPKIHNLFLLYVKEFKYQETNSYTGFSEIADSLKAGAKFLKTAKELPVVELMSCLSDTILGMQINQEYKIIEMFYGIISEQEELSASEAETVQDLTVRLLASSNTNLKLATYKISSDLCIKWLGPSASALETNHYSPLIFLLSKKVLKEIICYGLTSNQSEIHSCSENVLVLILKSQLLVSIMSWRWLISEITPIFSLLHSFAEINSSLGRTILGMLDPDNSQKISLPPIEVLTGNIRLMMSKNDDCRNEATARVIFLLNIPSHIEISQSFCLGENPISGKTPAFGGYEESSLVRVIDVLLSNPSDVQILKSALTQLSLVMEDRSLHVIFLDLKGLDIIHSYLHSSVENPTDDSKSIFTPVIAVFKFLARFNAQLRHDFSVDHEMYDAILKGVFLFNGDWRLLRDVSQLLAFMVYADVVITTSETISFPETIIQKIKLPFDVIPHSQVSEYYQPSSTGVLLDNKNIKMSLALLWHVSIAEGGVKEIIESDGAHLKKFASSCLTVSQITIDDLAMTHIPHNVNKLLISMNCTTSHADAEDILNKLKKYMQLAEISESTEGLEDLPWKRTFLRYLTTLPASEDDQCLLVSILQFLTYSAALVPGLVSWLSGIVKDPAFSLNSLLTKVTLSDSTSLGKELSLGILSLVEICLKNGESENWDYITNTLLQCLSYSHTQKYYSIAVLDSLLTCLLKITELKIFISPKSLWQLLNAFHCATPYSCMGLTITRLTLLCLCNLLSLKPKGKNNWFAPETKWLEKMMESKDLVVKAATLELLSGLSIEYSSQMTSQYPKIWDSSLSILVDHNESSLIREQASLLCANLIASTESRAYLMMCVTSELFSCITIMVARVQFSTSLNQTITKEVLSNTITSSREEGLITCVTTPKLLIAACGLILNLMAKNKEEIILAAHSQGLIPELFRQVSQWQSCKTLCNQERVDMYTVICQVLIHCTHLPATVVKDCVPTMVWLLQDSTYCEEVNKTGLITESLHLLGSIVSNQKHVDIIFTKEAIESLCVNAKSENSSTATAISHLIPYLSPDANVEIIRKMGKCPMSHRFLLASILGSSHAGTKAALECGLLEPLIVRMKETHINLAIMPPDIPRSKKANVALHQLSIDLCLLINFLAGSIETKELCVKFGLADIIHKLWAWCLLDVTLLSTLLQVLITFTANSTLAASTLVLTSTMTGVGQRKTPTSSSILHAVITLLSKEVYNVELRKMALELLSHASQALEARMVMNKSILLSEFLKLGQSKRSSYLEDFETSWLQFLVNYSSFPEGQASIMKHDDVLDQIMDYLTCGKNEIKCLALSIFRNLTFNPAYKHRFISTEKLMKFLSERCVESNVTSGELQDILLIVWCLAVNSQRGKYAVRNVNLDSRLQTAVVAYPEESLIFKLSHNIFPIIKPP